jgi:glutathione synthase/RimK-type ligase-like ATP-grasp enzyme
LRPRIALATWSGLPNLADSDRALQSALNSRGADALAAVWDAPRDWTNVDAVVIRSCWDYHRRRDEFLGWIASLETAAVRVMNSPRVIRWNSHKGYLDQLAEQGIPVVPTIAATHATVANAIDEARQLGWRKLVVKPCPRAPREW